jgi:hypothetical protein
MSRQTRLVTACALTVLALLVFSRNSEEPKPTAASVAPVARAERPGSQPAKSALAQAAPVTAKASATQDEAATDGVPKLFVAETLSVEQRLMRARERQELMGRFSSERASSDWTREVSDLVDTTLSESDLDELSLKEADCRQTVCKLGLRSHGSNEDEVMGLIHAVRSLHPETWLWPEQQSDGSWDIEAFLPREGYRLSAGGGRVSEPLAQASAGER